MLKVKEASFDGIEKKGEHIDLIYSWDSKYTFRHTIKAPHLPENWEGYAFLAGLARFPYYFSGVNPDKIVVAAGKLDPDQIATWTSWYTKGLGQFFYSNNLEPVVNLTSSSKVSYPVSDKKLSDGALLLNGGGKDSAVSGEILKELGIDFTWFVLGPNETRKKIIATSGNLKAIYFSGSTDGKIVDLRKKRSLYWGHQPLSLYLASLAALGGELSGLGYLVTSNEKSSNYGNLDYRGQEINHQYTKSFEFEQQFHSYIKKYLNPNLEYFSLLRPLWELQIVKLFSTFPQYHNYFVSCNNGVHSAQWCGMCSKCAFIFLALYPFVETQRLVKIFGKNLLDDRNLLDTYLELTGIKNHKPFECVGTEEESLAAMYLASKKDNPPYIVQYFIDNISELVRGKKYAEEIMKNYDESNLIPGNLRLKIKQKLKKLLRDRPA